MSQLHQVASALGDVAQKTFAFLTAKQVDIAGVPHAILPAGVQLESLAPLLERDAPRRIRRDMVAHDVRGLVDYVNTFSSTTTKLYCGPASAPHVLARLDDHHPGTPSHVSHVCSFGCPRTVEWTTWTGKSKVAMTQVTFAEFIEANAKDIRKPAAADLFQLVTNFSDARSAEFSSALRLSDGLVQLSFVQKDQPGKVVLPEKIELAVPVFEGAGKAYIVDARFRYRLKESALSLWYELDRPDVVERAAYDDLLALVTEGTKLAIYRAL